jgi:NAD-binding protein
LSDRELINEIFAGYKPDIVVNLSAQAGVRYSITNPDAYIQSNLLGFYNILEACRHSFAEGNKSVEHLIYASSSSVYGGKVQIYNQGNCKRDFTYIDDIVEGVIRVMKGAPERRCGCDGLPVPPYAVYNIGGGTPEILLDFIEILQEELLRAKVLPSNYDFDSHKVMTPM